MAQSRKLGWDADSAVGLAVGLGCLSRSRSRGRAELKLKQGMARDLQYACTGGSGNFVGAAAVRVCHNYL